MTIPAGGRTRACDDTEATVGTLKAYSKVPRNVKASRLKTAPA
jgi:hypothetical protein